MPRLAAALLLATLLPWLAGGCGDDDDEPSTPPDGTYHVEGVVESMPRQGADRREMSIAHEAIDDFVNREGEHVHMEAMTMQFAVAPDVDLQDVSVGDRVGFTFEVRWNDRPMLLVTRLHAE